MGPQVKTGTHSVRRGTPSVPVGALARGEPYRPLLLSPSSIHPALCPSTRHPSLMLIYCAESPRNAPPSPALPSHSPSTLSLIRPLLPLSSPTHSASFRLTSTHFSLPLFPPSPINHPFMTPVAKLLNYHTFVMILVRTRHTALIVCPRPLIMRISVLVWYSVRMKPIRFDIFQ